mgnify:CR=1 FL=1
MQITDLDTDTDNTKLIESSLEATNKIPLTYIRQARNAEGEGFAVCSENGEVLACFANYDAAVYTARQFRLEPLLVH